jgi:hypothetical protein
MPPVLFTPHYTKPESFHIPRQYCTFLVVQWAAQFVVSCGPELILQETLFGGYQAHIQLHSWFWASSSKTIKITDLFETVYVTPPGGGSPISALDCEIDWIYDPHSGNRPGISFVMAGTDHETYSYQPLPPAVSNWQPPWPAYSPDCHTAVIPP